MTSIRGRRRVRCARVFIVVFPCPCASAPDPEQTRCIGTLDKIALRASEARYTCDQRQRIVLAHVVRIIGAEQYMISPVTIDHVAQHPRIEGDGVEIEFFEILRRWL